MRLQHSFFTTLLVVLSSISLKIHAQAPPEREPISFGVKTALNISGLSGTNTEDYNMKTGLALGGFTELTINDKVSLKPELLFSMQGAVSQTNNVDTCIKMNYIDLPILVKFDIIDRLYAEIGPELGFLISAKQKTGDLDSISIKDIFNTLEVGLNLGIGYEMVENILFSLRYNGGIRNIDDSNINDVTLRNNLFQFAVGYRF